jgi:hypothetical protein
MWYINMGGGFVPRLRSLVDKNRPAKASEALERVNFQK